MTNHFLLMVVPNNKRPLYNMDNITEIFDQIKAEDGPDLLEAMAGIFLRRIPKDIQAIEDAIIAKDATVLKQKAHLTAGSMSSLQFEIGYTLAKTAEKTAENGTIDDAIQEATHLVDYLKASLVLVQNYKHS